MNVDIQSPSNRRIVETARLKKRRARDAEARFLIEGTRETERAAEAGASIDEVFLCPEIAPPDTASLADRIAGTGSRLTTVSAIAFAKLTMRQNPDGIIVVAPTWTTATESLDRDLVLVAEAIEKPGNLGAMFRTADATGAALLIADATVDPFNPNVVRASQGALFSVPFAVTDTEVAIAWARDHGAIVVATPGAKSDYWDTDLSRRVSIVIGSEHAGISEAWRDAGTPVRIPMAGSADSLNASVSAAVLLYEAVRQRGSTES
ncbi:MAG: TrmH family RNA methyltransferase [Actinomycetota bacterium]|nr:TrmH family RNA methyltransferase [Actinomycetota bacterium]